MSYMSQKCEVLYDLGVTDTEKLEEYLSAETASITNEAKKEAKIDRLCHDVLMNFYDGDETFVFDENLTAEEYYEKLKKKYKTTKMLHMDTIIDCVGKRGLRTLRAEGFIIPCAVVRRKTVYSIC